MLLHLLFCFFLVANSQPFNWASLDRTSSEIKATAQKYGSLSGENDTLLNPNPNSTQSIAARILVAYNDEDNIWLGDTPGSINVIPTWTYLKAMSSMTAVIGNFLRTAYGSIFEDLPLETCNTITTPPEVILDSNLGFGPSSILLNSSDLSLLIPSHNCFLPQLNLYPNGPDFDTLRKFMPAYRVYLFQLNDYLECVLLYNAYPSYTKGVNCLEDYYFGSQDAAANPAFFDLMANKQDLENSIENFVASPFPSDVTQITTQTWTDFQYALNIARQYKDIARKVRGATMLIYSAMTKNYARLQRIKTCRTLEAEIYAGGNNITDFWCHYQKCFESQYAFSLTGNILSGDLSPQTTSICTDNVCPITQTYPDPFYCDVFTQCPDAWYCSLVDRHCFKKNARRDFNRQVNTTVCGYPRRLADASVVSGTVFSAFGGSVNESSLWFNTFWPQNCITTVTTVADTNNHLDIGPFTFSQVCYPFAHANTSNSFYVGGTTNCGLLGNTTITFFNVSYLYYVDGIATGYKNENDSVVRLANGVQSWQIAHCASGENAPLVFPDLNGTQNYNATTYMKCIPGNPNCITQNSTYVCYHNVQDVLRVWDHFLTVTNTVCTNERVYGNQNNITYNYTDPNANQFPPAPQNIPAGYTNSTFFDVSSSQYGSLSGTYTSHGGSVPVSLGPSEYADFVGFYLIQAPNSYKLCGRMTFHFSDNSTMYTEGKDYFLSTNFAPTLYYVATLAVDNSTGIKLYNPLVDTHPNPRFNDPNECYIVQVSLDANVPMIQSPPVGFQQFKNFWMDGVTPQFLPHNIVPVLYPCAAIFLRKILYVQNSVWLDSDVTDFPTGLADGDLRYVCARSLDMSATCSRLGAPMSSRDLTIILNSVNPPSDSIVFQL